MRNQTPSNGEGGGMQEHYTIQQQNESTMQIVHFNIQVACSFPWLHNKLKLKLKY